jgi:signal transduction histidine kinase
MPTHAAPEVWTTLRRAPRDLILAGGLLAAAELELVAVGPVPQHRVAVAAATALTLPFAWRRRRPLLVLAAMMSTFLIQTRLGVPHNAQVMVPLVWALACFGVAAYAPLTRAVAGLVVVAVPIGTLSGLGIVPGLSNLLYVAAIFTLVPWGAGRLYRRSREESVEYARQAARAEADGERRAHEVLEMERRRIARELHDIIAHSLSLMVLQAGAAGEVLTRSPDQARAALETVQDTGRQALVEMKRLLLVLRSPDATPSLGPQPGLADLGPLVDHIRAAGLDVTLSRDGDPAGDLVEIPAAIELSVYRVAQESLTNVVKHANAAQAQVWLRLRPRFVEVEVVDDGGAPSQVRGDGHGLIGMRERVALYRGEFDAGPGAGGFTVRARFPLGPEQPR